ncbi:MAG: hypothetical protein NWF04_05615 [Candidatus Bathyarchaeota archaeon]|nr:hypothetical protein [Candidatus Bathyarchaeota archaeon]
MSIVCCCGDFVLLFGVELPVFYSLAAALVLAFVNLYSHRMRLYAGIHKNRALSFFGGITAAYVFLGLLPKLLQAGEHLSEVFGSSSLVGFYEDDLFLVVFLGFLLFFSLEHLATRSRREQQTVTGQKLRHTQASTGVFVAHFSSFAFMTFVISFLLLFEFQLSPITAVLYTLAVALHLVIMDNSMVQHYKCLQVSIGRYIAALIPLIAWLVSVIFPEGITQAYFMLALVSGVILYHAIRSEVPNINRKKSLALFITGALIYSILLIAHDLAIAI